MKKEVVITGMGLICNAGNSVAEFYRSLSSPIFTDVNVKMSDRFNKSLDLDVLICPVDEKELTIDTKQFNNVTNRLGLKAVDECMKDYRLNGGKDKPQCVVVGSSVGGQDMLENFVFDMLDNNNSSNNKNMPINYKNNCNLGSLTKAITDYIDFEGKVFTVSTACTSSTNAIAIGTSLIESSDSDCVLVGGSDALCCTTIAGFRSLQLTGAKRCTPFGENRQGMTIGEGAAFLILEDKRNVLEENRSYYAEILGYAMNSDAYHMASPSEGGEGAYNLMETALKKAKLKPENVSFVNAHGTGTMANDNVEAMAIQRLMPNVPVASVKGLVGHSLGAAGAIEAIASVHVIKNRMAFENFNNYECASDCSDINLVQKGGLSLGKSPVIISNSFGFGGNSCTLIFGGE